MAVTPLPQRTGSGAEVTEDRGEEGGQIGDGSGGHGPGPVPVPPGSTLLLPPQ